MRVTPRAAFLLLLVAAAGGSSAQTVFVGDTFTGANGTTLQAHTPDSGGTWTRILGNNLDIQTNALRATATNAGDFYTNATTAPSANYVVGMYVTFTNNNANNYIDLIGRANVNVQSGYLAQLQANGAVIVWPVVGGTIQAPIINTTTAITLNVQHLFILQMSGTSITAYVDGTQFGPVTNNAVAGPGVAGLGLNANNIVQVTADGFFAGTMAVTEARMERMTARRHAGHALIEWTTGREAANLGFRVWRQEGAERRVITPSLVAGSALLTNATLTAGNHYRWVDAAATPRSRYWIESVALDGRTEWNGPILPVKEGQSRPTSVGRSAKDGQDDLSSTLLRDLGQRLTPAQSRARLTVAANDTRRASAPPPDLLAKQQALAAGPAVKISIDRDAWYRVTRDELIAAGLDGMVDPHLLHLYAEGREVAMTVEGEASGRVDAIRFYGMALDTPSTATRVYWLVAEEGTGERIGTGAAFTAGAPAQSFLATAERRDKAVFFASLANGDNESFFGPIITNDALQPATQTLSLPHIDRTAATAEIEIALQGATDAGVDPQHVIGVTLNGQPLDDIRFYGRDAVSIHRILPLDRFVDGDNTFSFTAKNGDGDVSLVSYVRVTYAHTYDLDGGSLTITSDGGPVRVQGLTSPALYALDVSAPAAPVELPVSIDNAVAHFAAPTGIRRTIVVTQELAHAASVQGNHPSALHAAGGADMIVIVHPSLLPAVEPLRTLREAGGLSVLVASVDDIYDEYGYGEKDPVVIRKFLADTQRWTTKPHYVLLVGSASLDPRNYLGLGDSDLVPTKLIVTPELKTSSDWWLVDFDDDSFGDLAIGRIPARTLAEAQLEIGKIVAYENAAPAPGWAKSALFVTDADNVLDFDSIAASARQGVPAGFTTETISVAAGGEVAAREELLAKFNDGALLIDYIGHGSVDIWTSSGLFAGSDAASLHNEGRLPFVVAMTCLNGYFQDASEPSLAEGLLRAPGGGAVGVFASSSLTDPHAQSAANDAFVHAVLAGHTTIGDAALAAQRAATDPNVRRTFLLFGDPAMHLKE